MNPLQFINIDGPRLHATISHPHCGFLPHPGSPPHPDCASVMLPGLRDQPVAHKHWAFGVKAVSARHDTLGPGDRLDEPPQRMLSARNGVARP